MKHPFFDVHEQAIEYSKFADCGWSADSYFYYRNLISQLRAALIVDMENSDNEFSSEMTRDILNDFLSWAGQACGKKIIPNYDLVYALKRKIRYLEHNEYGDVGDLPYFYRSEADFRHQVEKHLFAILNEHTEEAKFTVPYCSNRSHAVSLQKSLAAEKDAVLSRVERNIPSHGEETALYLWARKKEAALLQLEELDAQLSAVLWRIEEFDNGGEFNPAKNILYVFKGFIKCQRDDHNLVCVNAKIESKNGKYIYLNVNYCKDCKQFFISYSEYLHYRAMYGILIAKIVMINNGEYSNDIDYLAAESPLKLCGYSVSQAEGLSSKMRQDLLRSLIQSDIIKKAEVIRYLSWFIQVNGQKFGNEIARGKWESDLDYVRNLNTSKQDTHLISGIKAYPGYNKL